VREAWRTVAGAIVRPKEEEEEEEEEVEEEEDWLQLHSWEDYLRLACRD